ncbi:tRNA uridine-5-carboxymethylaminomethyl(34) synthesis GTPase MnmE [candidate division KSB1 bacterium]|nr:tRNA uridine-5-carboxymethylaminomethyl(34) synthesis GTPase MnmE [candidate division KSB1 bacterium]
MTPHNDDTIAAIATPIGTGGLAIIRISGSKTLEIVDKIFKSKHDTDELKSWHIYLGNLFDKKDIIDEVTVSFYRSPRSYTTEDIVEIGCHGGIFVARRILDVILENGARLAEPGEFTKRAFINGRIDLSQAEAVADLIHSKTEISRNISLKHMEGQLYEKIERIRNELIDILSLLEIELDFSEEDIEFVERENFIIKLNHTIEEIEHLINSYSTGKIIKEGINLIIIGKRNVGKSSLLNALLREDRAIVTEIPGTTRDVLEEQLDIKGILFNVIDTAGIAETDDPVEKEGIKRTHGKIERANIVIHVLDFSNTLTKEDQSIISKVESLSNQKGLKIISVINKIDLDKKIEIEKISYFENNIPIVRTSAKTFAGIDDLEDMLYQKAFEGENKYNTSDVIITKKRHVEALKKCSGSLKRALKTSQTGLSSEFISVDLREALDSLGEIIGIVTNEDILKNIFEKFCIGK